jgi:CTP:molybdopterin cytidylyltransferase MocA
MGTPKAGLTLAGRPLAAWLEERLERLGFAPVVTVLNEETAARLGWGESREGGRIRLLNRHLERGMFHSVELASAQLGAAVAAALVLPVDHPFVEDRTLERLRRAARRDRVVIPSHAGLRGHPPVVGLDVLSRLPEANPEQGLRGLWRLGGVVVEELEVEDEGVLLNANAPDGWQRGLRLLAKREEKG